MRLKFRRHWKAGQPSFLNLALSTWIEIALTVLLIGVAASQARIYQQQAGIMDTQAKIMKDTLEQTRIATNAARDQATAAQSQAQTAITELRSSRRPWLDFDGDPVVAEPLTFTAGGTATLALKVSAKNVGASPAIGVSFQNALYVRPLPVSHDFSDLVQQYVCHPRQEGGAAAFPSRALIVPGDSAPLWPSKGVTDDITTYKDSATIQAWCSLCLRYQDEFGAPHTIGQIFHYITDGPIKLPAVGQLSGRLQPFTSKVTE